MNELKLGINFGQVVSLIREAQQKAYRAVNVELSTLSRELSSAPVSQYELALPNKKMLQAKLRELSEANIDN